MYWKNIIEKELSKKLSQSIVINSFTVVGGGSINEAYKIGTNNGNFFIKKNSKSLFPQMFEKEAKGIQLLKSANEITLPNVIHYMDHNNDSFLIMDYIETGKTYEDFWIEFGKKLALLHKHTNSFFGLDHDNYIGSLVQKNIKHDTWGIFFIQQRIQPQVILARNNGLINKNIISKFEYFFKKVDEIFPPEKPSLLHGDLWSGNFMINKYGWPVIIDPAVYYGHREMDIAMTKLFGGFNSQFYNSYNNYYPLVTGWEKRVDFCNLYPLIVHVNLFGQSYVSQVESVLKKF